MQIRYSFGIPVNERWPAPYGQVAKMVDQGHEVAIGGKAEDNLGTDRNGPIGGKRQGFMAQSLQCVTDDFGKLIIFAPAHDRYATGCWRRRSFKVDRHSFARPSLVRHI